MLTPNTHTNEAELHGVLDAYIKYEAVYAIMIDGPWGSGKTHAVKAWIERQNNAQKRIVYASLYGKETVEDVQREVFSDIYRQAHNKEVAVSVMSAFVSSVLRYNFDFKQSIKVESEIQKELSKGDWVFVFDDVERCLLHSQALLGFLNQFVEHGSFHVVLLANRNQFKVTRKEGVEETYSDKRKLLEKVIGEEYTYTPNISDVIQSFIERLHTRASSSSQATWLHLAMVNTQEELQSKNLRHAKVVSHQARKLFHCTDHPTFNILEQESPELFQRLWNEYAVFAYLIQMGYLETSSLFNLNFLYRKYQSELMTYQLALFDKKSSESQQTVSDTKVSVLKNAFETLQNNQLYQAFYREEKMVHGFTPERYTSVEWIIKRLLEQNEPHLMRFWINYFVHRQCSKEDIFDVLEIYRWHENLLCKTFIEQLYNINEETLHTQIQEFKNGTDISCWEEKKPKWNETKLIQWVRTGAYFIVCADYDEGNVIDPKKIVSRVDNVLQWLNDRDLLDLQIRFPFQDPSHLGIEIHTSFFIDPGSTGLDFSAYKMKHRFLMSEKAIHYIDKLEHVQNKYVKHSIKKLIVSSRKVLLEHLDQGSWLDLHLKHYTLPLFDFDSDEDKQLYIKNFIKRIKTLNIMECYDLLNCLKFRLNHLKLSSQEADFMTMWWKHYKLEPMASIQQRLQRKELVRFVEDENLFAPTPDSSSIPNT